jgi:hypothetical protein
MQRPNKIMMMRCAQGTKQEKEALETFSGMITANAKAHATLKQLQVKVLNFEPIYMILSLCDSMCLIKQSCVEQT